MARRPWPISRRFGHADAAGFPGRVRREVVVQHEALGVLALQGVDALLVLPGAEGGRDDGLRLAAGEEDGTVHARQQRRTDGDRAHGARVAPVDARLAVQDLAAHDLRLDVLEDAAHDVAVGGRIGVDDAGVEHALLDVLELLLAHRLRLDAIGLVEVALGEAADLLHQRLVVLRRSPVPVVLAALVGQLGDGADRGLHLLVAVHDRAEHHLLGQFARLRLDHQDRLRGSRHDQVQLRALELGLGRVEDVLTVEVTHARGADRTVERDAGQRHRRGGADHRGDVGVHFRIDRQDRGDDLHLVVETVGEQRAERSIDEAAGEDFLLRGTPLALEEAAGDAPRRVGLLLVVDGEGKEILPGLHVLAGGDGDEHHGVVHRDEHGTIGLAGDFAGFQGHLVLAERKGLLDRFHGSLSFPNLGRGNPARFAHGRPAKKTPRTSKRERRGVAFPGGNAYLRRPRRSIVERYLSRSTRFR